jgi:alpha-1,3-rhamnosyltransferase
MTSDADSKSGVVSVVVPSRNHARFVEESIASAVAQTYEALELIVVDDGSDDDSVDVIRRVLRESHPRFDRCVFVTQRHRGLPATLNRALRLAQGEFVSILDSDDVLRPHKIERLIRADAWASPTTAAVFGDVSFIDECGRPFALGVDFSRDPSCRTGYTTELGFGLAGLGRRPAEDELGSYPLLLETSHIPDGAALIRSRALRAAGGFDRRVVTTDYGLWLSLSRLGKLVFVDDIVAEKRWHRTNTSLRHRDRMVRDATTLLVRERRHCRDTTLAAVWERAFAAGVHTILVENGRRGLLALLRCGNPLVTMRDLARIRRQSIRARLQRAAHTEHNA